MGENSLINYELIKKIYPVRKFVLAASILFIFLSLLIVLESAFLLTANNHDGSSFLMIFSYLLAWILIAAGLVGLKVGFMAQSFDPNAPASNSISLRPSSAPAWINARGEEFDYGLPGEVQTTSEPQLYPPPPPRYSSLGDVPPDPPPRSAGSRPTTRTSRHSRNSSRALPIRPPFRLSGTGQSRMGTGNSRRSAPETIPEGSPPPPYGRNMRR